MKETRNFVLRGNICYSLDPTTLETIEAGYLVCEDGTSAGVYRELPEQYAGWPLKDFGDRLIIPGLTDLHPVSYTHLDVYKRQEHEREEEKRL